MDTVSQNGILRDEEFGRFKERTVKLRFMQQISYGLGAAMVFGLFTAAAGKLASLAAGAAATVSATGVAIPAVAASLPAMIGLGVIALGGIALIYLSAKFLSENTLLEQDFQAKKIGLAARGPVLEQQLGNDGRTVQFPAQTQIFNADAADSKPKLVVNNVSHRGSLADNTLEQVR
ncbi:MAG: hypothetical protein ACOYNL_09115 [Rickettsiales bacterium]